MQCISNINDDGCLSTWPCFFLNDEAKMAIITEGLECHTKEIELSRRTFDQFKAGDGKMYKKADLPHSPRWLLQVQVAHVTIRF